MTDPCLKVAYYALIGMAFGVYLTSAASDSINNDDTRMMGELPRQFVVSNISQVITYVSFVVALVMLAGFIWVAFAFRGNASHGSGYDSRGYHDINWILFQDIQNQSRQSRVKRSKDMDIDQELAAKLTVLNESFRKFDMESIGCQMLLSCESAQLETAPHPIYGQLVPKIHRLLSKTKGRDLNDARIVKLRQAHREGRFDGTSCKKLYGDLCPKLGKKFEHITALSPVVKEDLNENFPIKESHKKLAKKQQYSAAAAAAAAAYRTFKPEPDYDDVKAIPKVEYAKLPAPGQMKDPLGDYKAKKKQYLKQQEKLKKKYRGAYF